MVDITMPMFYRQIYDEIPWQHQTNFTSMRFNTIGKPYWKALAFSRRNKKKTSKREINIIYVWHSLENYPVDVKMSINPCYITRNHSLSLARTHHTQCSHTNYAGQKLNLVLTKCCAFRRAHGYAVWFSCLLAKMHDKFNFVSSMEGKMWKR